MVFHVKFHFVNTCHSLNPVSFVSSYVNTCEIARGGEAVERDE